MSQLKHVHHQLCRLRRHRAIVRIGATAGWYLSAILLTPAFLYLLDLIFEMGLIERVGLSVLLLGGLAWGAHRWMIPALTRKEDDVTLALQVEKRLGLSSDLVAAIQFEHEDKNQGSLELRQMVIEAAEEVSRDLDYLEGVGSKPLYRGLGMLCCVVIASGVVFMVQPAAAVIFFGNRLWLGSERYPTDTKIQTMTMAVEPLGTEHWLVRDQQTNTQASSPRGQKLIFTLNASGVLPEAGTLQIESTDRRVRETIALTAVPGKPGTYQATLEKAIQDMRYRARLGDDYTQKGEININPWPHARLTVQVTPPSYTGEPVQRFENARRVVIQEGASVRVTMQADQEIQSAWLISGEQSKRHEQVGRDHVIFDENTPQMTQINEARSYSFGLKTTDGLPLESLLTLDLDIKEDQAPKVQASTEITRVLPNARPRLNYEVHDDYAIKTLKLLLRVNHTDGRVVDHYRDIALPQGRSSQLSDETRLDLTSLDLMIGDQVLAIVQATDDRGSQEGITVNSAPTLMEVTDLNGVLSSVDEMDETLDRRLDTIIKTQMDIGDTP